MPALARSDLEALLRTKQLDRTLTPASRPSDDFMWAPIGVPALDTALGGGFPRGQLSEIVGGPSSGRTSLVLHMLAAATARGELVALADTLDRFDVASGAAAGIDVARLLWIRGRVVSSPGPCREANHRAIEHAVQALALVLQAGVFGLVVFDLADAPHQTLRRLPFTTWLRIQRIVEGGQTACVLVGTEHIARSAAGLTLQVKGAARRLTGFDIEARHTCARDRHHEPLCVSVSATSV
jgi:hypothetical protein